MLVVTDLKTGYGKKQVLNGVSLAVDEGEIVLVIGHNGAGKSTLLKAVFGLLQVWNGTVEFSGRQIHNSAPVRNARDGLAFVMQGNRVFTELSVQENLEVGGYLLSGRAQMRSRMDDVFDLFPILAKRKRQNAGTLSGGEQQMLALATALMPQPRMLLMDEPSLGLSPNMVHDVLQRIRDLNQSLKTTVLIVEQRVREALTIAHRVYILKLGEVAFEGKSNDLMEGDKLREIYLA